jgi:hypothetical protein
MKPVVVMLLVVLSSTAALACCGPSRHGSGQSENGAATDVIVTGTCVDAESGEKLSGVKIAAPGEKSAISGRDGRFEIRGLRAGDEGALEASLSDGRRAKLMLRPLKPGTLEVVLQLAPAR